MQALGAPKALTRGGSGRGQQRGNKVAAVDERLRTLQAAAAPLLPCQQCGAAQPNPNPCDMAVPAAARHTAPTLGQRQCALSPLLRHQLLGGHHAGRLRGLHAL